MPEERDPGRHRPLFLLAPARSNSSICASMIGAHPELYGFPELSLFTEDLLGPTIEREVDGFGPGSRNTGLLRALAQLHEREQSPEAVARGLEWCRERADWSAGDVFDHLLDLVAPLVGVEKSPETSSSSASLSRTAHMYPSARFLHLTRHPVTSQRSMQEHWDDRPWWPKGPDLPGPSYCAQIWFDTHRRIKSFCETLPAERTMRVRSEDLLNDEGQTLERIARWLGIGTHTGAIAAMRAPQASPYASVGPPGARGGYDPKFLMNPVPHHTAHPPVIEFNPNWEVEPVLQVNCALLAAELGYASEP